MSTSWHNVLLMSLDPSGGEQASSAGTLYDCAGKANALDALA
jgi:hypothetical protein